MPSSVHSVAREESRRRHCASPLLSMLDSRPLLTNIPRTQSLLHTTYNLRPSFSSSPVLHSSCTLCIIFAHMHLFHSHSKNGQYFSFHYVYTITYVKAFFCIESFLTLSYKITPIICFKQIQQTVLLKPGI